MCMQGEPTNSFIVLTPDIKSISLLARFEGRLVQIHFSKEFSQHFPKKNIERLCWIRGDLHLRTVEIVVDLVRSCYLLDK